MKFLLLSTLCATLFLKVVAGTMFTYIIDAISQMLSTVEQVDLTSPEAFVDILDFRYRIRYLHPSSPFHVAKVAVQGSNYYFTSNSKTYLVKYLTYMQAVNKDIAALKENLQPSSQRTSFEKNGHFYLKDNLRIQTDWKHNSYELFYLRDDIALLLGVGKFGYTSMSSNTLYAFDMRKALSISEADRMVHEKVYSSSVVSELSGVIDIAVDRSVGSIFVALSSSGSNGDRLAVLEKTDVEEDDVDDDVGCARVACPIVEEVKSIPVEMACSVDEEKILTAKTRALERCNSILNNKKKDNVQVIYGMRNVHNLDRSFDDLFYQDT